MKRQITITIDVAEDGQGCGACDFRRQFSFGFGDATWGCGLYFEGEDSPIPKSLDRYDDGYEGTPHARLTECLDAERRAGSQVEEAIGAAWFHGGSNDAADAVALKTSFLERLAHESADETRDAMEAADEDHHR